MAGIYDFKAKTRDEKDGKVVYRFGPTDKPEEMEEKVKELL